MSRGLLLAGWGLAWGLLSACGSTDDAADFAAGGGEGPVGTGGAAGTSNEAGQGGGVVGPPANTAGQAGHPGQGGQAGKGDVGGQENPSDACKECVRGVCLNCPANDPVCEPCSVEPGLCRAGGSEILRRCVCGQQCGAECDGSTYCSSEPSNLVEECFNGVDDNGDGVVDCDDPVCQDLCAVPCLKPPSVSVGAEGVTLGGRWKGHANVLTPYCSSVPQSGPDIVYSVTSTVTGFLRVKVASVGDAIVSVRPGCDQGLDLLCSNNVGPTGIESLETPVVAGQTLALVVGAVAPGATDDFTVDLRVAAADCGDGLVTPDEECDAGADNGSGGGSCDALCHLTACQNAPSVPATGVVTKADETTDVQPSCVPLENSGAPEHIYAVRAEVDGRLEAVLRSGDKDLTLSVRSSCKAVGAELGCSDEAPAGPGATERVVVSAVKGQTFYVVVESYDGTSPGDYSLWTSSAAVDCGDGVVGVTEQCDGAGDCTGQCTLVLPGQSAHEQEPNNLTYQSEKLVDAVEGEIQPPGDVDLYTLELSGDGTLEARIDSPGSAGASCTALVPGQGLLDSELRLRTLDGTLLARNDNANGVCSTLSLPVTKGSYRLEVRASSASPEQVFSYILHTSVKTSSLP